MSALCTVGGLGWTFVLRVCEQDHQCLGQLPDGEVGHSLYQQVLEHVVCDDEAG